MSKPSSVLEIMDRRRRFTRSRTLYEIKETELPDTDLEDIIATDLTETTLTDLTKEEEEEEEIKEDDDIFGSFIEEEESQDDNYLDELHDFNQYQYEKHHKRSKSLTVTSIETLKTCAQYCKINRSKKLSLQNGIQSATTFTEDMIGVRESRLEEIQHAVSLDENQRLSPRSLFRRSEQFKMKRSGRCNSVDAHCHTPCLDTEFFARGSSIRQPIGRNEKMLRLRKQQFSEFHKTLTVDNDCGEKKQLHKKHSLNITNVTEEPFYEDDFDQLEQLLDGETEEDAVMRKEALRVRRRGSTVIQIPDATIQMDLHTLYLNRMSKEKKSSTVIDPKLARQRSKASESEVAPEDNDKKSGPFTLFKKTSKKKGNSTISFFGDFKDFLEYLRSNLFEISENELVSFKGSHWSTIGNFHEHMTFSETEMIKQAKLSKHESTRFEALWELFYAEVTYLADNLLVLQDVFLRTLEHAKKYGFLSSIEENVLFGNLEALVKVTTAFASMMLEIFKECGASISRSTEIIVDGFKEFPNLLTPQYRDYCLNYQQALSYLKRLKEDDENFHEFIKICEGQKRCARRQLEDLLVSPLQHLTKYPLLLKAIRKRTPREDPNHDQLSDTIVNLEESIKSIEVTFSREVNMLRLKEINSSLQWPLLADTDNKFSIPEFIRLELVNTTHCDPLLENPDRVLLHEGILTLNDSSKAEVYVFLFSDIMLITKVRKKVKRPNTSNSEESSKTPHYKASIKGSSTDNNNNNMQYIVHKQPIPINNLKLFDCDDQTSGVKTGFCVVQFNNFHQVLYVYTLQAASDDVKQQWLTHLKKAMRNNRVSVEVTDCSTPNHISSDEDLALTTS